MTRNSFWSNTLLPYRAVNDWHMIYLTGGRGLWDLWCHKLNWGFLVATRSGEKLTFRKDSSWVSESLSNRNPLDNLIHLLVDTLGKKWTITWVSVQKKQNNNFSLAWWCISLILALRRLKQADLWVRSQSDLYIKWVLDQPGLYRETLSLKKKNIKKIKTKLF